MPNLPISQLPEITAITSNAEFAVAQNGTTYKVKAANLSSGNLYLSAYESITQSGFTPNTAYSVSASTVADSYGISVIDGCKFTVSTGGTYNLQFSLQLNNIGGGLEHIIDIWLSKNNNNVEWSNTRLNLSNNNTLLVAAWNFIMPMNTNDYLELKVSVNNSDVIIQAENESVSPTRPGIPSAIITMMQI